MTLHRQYHQFINPPQNKHELTKKRQRTKNTSITILFVEITLMKFANLPLILIGCPLFRKTIFAWKVSDSGITKLRLSRPFPKELQRMSSQPKQTNKQDVLEILQFV